MELIIDKIKENIKKHKELIDTANKIKDLRVHQDNIIFNYNELVSTMCKKLTKKRILTTLKINDVCKKDKHYISDEALLGINTSGFGSLSSYSRNLYNMSIELVIDMLNCNIDKIKHYFNKNGQEILETFKNTLSELTEIREIKLGFKINVEDFNSYPKKLEITEFDTSTPKHLGYNSIGKIEYYIMIENKYDELKAVYEQTIEKMTANNIDLQTKLQKLQNGFACYLVSEAL